MAIAAIENLNKLKTIIIVFVLNSISLKLLDKDRMMIACELIIKKFKNL